MSGVNKAIIVGNLGGDPKSNRTQDGRLIVNFSVATSESWKDKNTGERRERTQWHRVVIFNEGLAGVAEKYLGKGSKVYIEGQMETRSWTDQGGVEKYVTEVIVRGFGHQLVLLDRKEGVPPNDGSSEAERGSSPSTGKPPIDDEIPF